MPDPRAGAGLEPPLALRRPVVLSAHGEQRVDDWFWVQDADDPETLAYLEAENRYAEAVLASTGELQQTLYDEIRGRIQEDDASTPIRKGPWWYYSRTARDRQYRVHCRRGDAERVLSAVDVMDQAGGPGEEVMLDENELAGASDYFLLGLAELSPDQSLLAYATDTTGGERYLLRFRDLCTGTDLADSVEGVGYSAAWSVDNRSVFYVRQDASMRPHQVWRHDLGDTPGGDHLVYQEDDEQFAVHVGLTHSERFILIGSHSKTASEVRFVDASDPQGEPAVIQARQQGVEYLAEHAVMPEQGDSWLILTNAWDQENFALYHAPVATPDCRHWQVLVPHRQEVKVEAAFPFARHVVVAVREQGLRHLDVLRLSDGDCHRIEQPEPVYCVSGASSLEFSTATARFGYSSLVTPESTIEYDLETRSRTVIKQNAVLGRYAPSRYRTERLWAVAADGTSIPMSVVYDSRLERDGRSPCLLYGYGAYDVSLDPSFSNMPLSLVERGFVFAMAHVRGGGELGRHWYEQGKLLRKKNSFTDFLACAEHLISAGYTSPDRLVIRGESAGGLLVGAAVNMRPDLFTAVVAESPFVDCLGALLDADLPLTATEWEEWGNPVEDPEAYHYIKSYSPYENVASTAYPSMYVSAGLNDPRVRYWEPAKWVARLRAQRTDERPLILRTELTGHLGPSGRYDAWRDESRILAFILTSVGWEE